MWVRILLLFFVFSFLFRSDHSFDQDLGRHLKLGEIIWQTKSVPQTNLFSFTYPDFPFINTHWLFEVFVFFASQIIGLQALLILKIIIFLISVYLILAVIPKEGSALLLPVGFIFLHVLRERIELRPEIFSFLFTSVTCYILNDFIVRAKSRTYLNTIYLLPLVQLFWINTHIYFFVGLTLQAIFLIHLAYQHLHSHLTSGKLKLLTIVFSLSVLISLINPYGITGLLYPLHVAKNYGYTIVENQTMFLLESINFKDPNFLFVKLASVIILLSIVIALVKRRFSVKNLGLAGVGLTLALMNVRSFPYLAFVSLPAVLQNFGGTRSTLWHKTIIFAAVPLLLFESFLYLNGDYYKYTDSNTKPKLEFAESGRQALDFVLVNNLPQPIYNNFDIGSYIFYRAYPKYRVFVDGRPEAYPKEFFQQVYIPAQYEPQKFKELDQKIGFKTIIFSINDQTPWGKAFLTSVVKNPDWKTVYLDDFMIILVKNDLISSQGLSLKDTPLDLSKLDTGSYQFNSYLSYLRLSLFLAQTGNIESAEKFARAGLSLFPKSPLGNALFGINVQNKFFW